MSRLWQLRRVLGPLYGSEDLCTLFYSLARRERPECVVELGAGLGVCSLWIARAFQELDHGHIWTVDDGSQFDDERIRAALVEFAESVGESPAPWQDASYADFFARLCSFLGLSEWTSLVDERLDFGTPGGLFDELLERIDQPINWLFADIQCGVDDIFAVLGQSLPHLSVCASIFIDSASTFLPSYLALEQIVEQLNRSKVPYRMLQMCAPDHRRRLTDIIAQRRFTLMHLVEQKQRPQNSTAWIRMEPCDSVPWPQTWMRT